MLLVVLAAVPGFSAAQGVCGDAPPTRLVVGQGGRVSFTDGQPLNVRDAAGLNGARVAQLPEGTAFLVLEGPVCADNIYWWRIQAGLTAGWVAEGLPGQYFVEPVAAPGAAVLPTPVPLPTVEPGPAPVSAEAFVAWDWNAFVGGSSFSGMAAGLPDPMTIVPPPVYAGNLPALPVNVGEVRFVDDAALSEAQRALLAQNGFVVVPGGLRYFDEAYREDANWSMVPPDYDWASTDPSTQDIGHGFFVTTDSMLWALHYIFDNMLTDLEKVGLYPSMESLVSSSLQVAVQQAQEAVGTPLEPSARNAALYLAVSLKLLSPGASLPPDLATEAEPIVQMALAGEGQYGVPFLAGYEEDFSQYRPRGHYAGDPMLEAYFRGMMWLSRITLLANDDSATQMALLLLRALRLAPGRQDWAHSLGMDDDKFYARPGRQGAAFTALDQWQQIHETLGFLVGPADDLGPAEYNPLAEEVFGADLSLAALADPTLLAAFRARVATLPGPRVNGLIVPDDTTADEVAEITRGFRFMGQRFTFDGYVLGQLMYPYVGTRENPRLLPLGLDVPAAMGSDVAYALATEAGAADYLNYDTQMAAMRGELAQLTPGHWLENVYGGWLWALQPLWLRENPAAYPPLMQTEAWLRRDLQAGLASWTTLKHDTVLYAKQPTGFGGGGPPLTSFGYVEPNPLVFARIAVVAATLHRGLVERGFISPDPGIYTDGDPDWVALLTSDQELQQLVFLAVEFAEAARRELAGEALTEDDYWRILGYGTNLNVLLRTLYQGEGNPDPVALVTDVASNPSAQTVLQEAVGGVDYIYVVVPAPNGELQLVRGGVFSYYEWVGNINQRMTDDEWRAQVESGQVPPRPGWVSAFMGE